MSQEPIEMLRRGYQAFNEGDVDAIASWLAPEKGRRPADLREQGLDLKAIHEKGSE